MPDKDAVAVALVVAVAAAVLVFAFAAFFAVNPGGSFIFLLLLVVNAEAFVDSEAFSFVVVAEDALVASIFILFLDPLRLDKIDFFLIMLLLLPLNHVMLSCWVGFVGHQTVLC